MTGGTRDTRAGQANDRTRAWVAWVCLVAGSVGLFWPAIVASISADSRYQVLWQVGNVGSIRRAVVMALTQDTSMLEQGRIVPVATLQQRVVYIGLTDVAVASGADISMLHGILRALLLVVTAWSVWLAARSLRARDASGTIIGLSRRTLTQVTVLVGVLLVAGLQMQNASRNGWMAYSSVLTYHAAPYAFLTIALLLSTARAVAGRSRVRFPLLGLVAVCAALLALNFELYFVSVPLGLLALLLTPLPGTRALKSKLITGAVFAGVFAGVTIPVRMVIARACATQSCYDGVVPELGLGVVRTFAANMVTGVPAFGRTEAARDLARTGHDLPPLFSGWGWFWSALVIVGLFLVVRTIEQREDSAPLVDGSVARQSDGRFRWPRGEVGVLVTLASLALALSVGSALIMSISSLAQELIRYPGEGYRCTYVVWSGFAVAAASMVLIVQRTFAGHRHVGRIGWILVAVFLIYVGGVVRPVNTLVVAANKQYESVRISDSIHRAVVSPNFGPDGDAQRCQLLEDLDQGPDAAGMKRRTVRGAELAFTHYWGRPFCSSAG